MKKLSLNKETIANLDNNAMNSVKGGTGISCLYSCYTYCGCYTDLCITQIDCPDTRRCVISAGCGAYTDDCAPSESICC